MAKQGQLPKWALGLMRLELTGPAIRCPLHGFDAMTMQ
jgi:hypothetical protein